MNVRLSKNDACFVFMSLYLRLHLLHIALILVSSFADKNALQFTINLISIAVAANKTCGVHKWGGGGGREGGVIRVC